MKENLVIIGNGMVGYKFIEKLTDLENSNKYNLITFCEEPRPAYDRVNLTKFFSGKSEDDLRMAALDWYTERKVTLHVGDSVTTIDREQKIVTSKNGKSIPYDKIVLATGSLPFVPPIPGVDKDGIFVYRTIEDLKAIAEYSKRCKTAAVIGGGLLGLEAAKVLVDLNLETEVIEYNGHLMSRQIDPSGSEFLIKKIEELNVGVRLNTGTKEFIGNGKVEGMKFADEGGIAVDMVVISAGIRPRDELAKECGLTIGQRGGIFVNDYLQTSDPDIYAIGECALHNGMIYGLVAPGYRMAEVAANHLMGVETRFLGADMSTKLKLMGVDVASIGNSTREGDGIDSYVFMDTRNGIYKKILLSQSSNTLEGAILVGDASEYTSLFQHYINKTEISGKPESLIVKTDTASTQAGVASLPDTAQICSCENVSKQTINNEIEAGCKDVATLKKCTKAGTGCGSCVPLLTDLINDHLEKAGIEINKNLCEHFAYTRQSLVDIIKVSRIKTYDELLSRYGTGRGCEVCKPAVASILASTWNEHVMDQQPIQDTNDYFLANMQKNGTYSVVPRVPGGEIQPEQLIAMGEVAKEYSLYTKITGGQRIDLFGARLEDLPDIWEKLGKVGLESGHAYAKALRTVKSCVGQTWCRFGVQDSTSLAIEVENRYKGLRTPHKVKMAVSGCARECAEAQNKDVGIIATEKGWNLYVCGNGGMKPQHALLFAEDLDKETLIKYIDRFLMYYVRTADRLTRTATWLNKLPGGLNKLQEVVIEDSLNICEELEREMQYVVDTYECEWKKTVEDPNKRKRFSHFVNVRQSDPNIKTIKLRGQLQPAPTTEKEDQPQPVLL